MLKQTPLKHAFVQVQGQKLLTLRLRGAESLSVVGVLGLHSSSIQQYNGSGGKRGQHFSQGSNPRTASASRNINRQQESSRPVMGTQHPINGQQSGAHRALIACRALFRCPFVLPVWCWHQHCCGGLHPPCQTFPNFLEFTDIPSYSSLASNYFAKADNPKAQPRQRHQDNGTMAKNTRTGTSKAARKQAGIQVSFWYYWLTPAMNVWSVARQCDNLRVGGFIAVVKFIVRSLLDCVLS